MSKPKWPVLDPSKIADTFDSWRKGVLFPFQTMTDQVRAMLTGGLTFTDNMFASIIEFDAQHGVEALFLPPDRMGHPLTFIPINATLASGADVAIAAKSVINYQPLVNGIPRTDRRLGITVQYAPPLGAVDLVRTGTGLTMASGATVPMQFDGRTRADQGALSCDVLTTSGSPAINSRIVCAASGIIDVTAIASWSIAGAGSVINLGYIGKNNDASKRWGETGSSANTGGFQYVNPTALGLSVAAGDYVQFLLQQNSTLSNTTFAGSTDVPRLHARYIAPDPATTARVTGILVGA